MTLSEFKAWFEGFSEGIETAPTADQFAKIKAKVALIDGAPITYPIYVEKFVPSWPFSPYHPPYYPYWTSTSGGSIANVMPFETTVVNLSEAAVGLGSGYSYIDPASKGDSQTVTFDSHAAMRELGRAEAA